MKKHLLGLLALCVCTTCFAEPPKTKEDFLAAVRAAYEAKDIQRIHELTWKKGMSEEDKKTSEATLPRLLKSMEIENITLAPLTPYFANPHVAFGKRTEPTYPPIAVLEFTCKNQGKDFTSYTMSLPYAAIDGSYYVVAEKTTDLGWKGPKDEQLGVTVWGKGWDKVAIHIKYNASGVDLERNQTAMSSLFVGQYIQEVTVTSKDDGVEDVTLRVKQAGEKEPSYISAPLKGKGQIVYKKGDAGVPSK